MKVAQRLHTTVHYRRLTVAIRPAYVGDSGLTRALHDKFHDGLWVITGPLHTCGKQMLTVPSDSLLRRVVDQRPAREVLVAQSRRRQYQSHGKKTGTARQVGSFLVE